MIFTKTPLANFLILLFQAYLSEHSWQSSPSIYSTFSRLRYRQFLHIAFVHKVDKDWGTLVNSEP